MPNGIQNNTFQSIDVVYTKLGRFYKSVGDVRAIPTQIAFSDDGVDYNLYDANLPELERGLKIERTPIFDAWTNEAYLMRNRLVTAERQSSDYMNVFSINPSEDILLSITDTPNTWYQSNKISIISRFPSTAGFEIQLLDSTYLYLNNPPQRQLRRPSAEMGKYGSYGTVPINLIDSNVGTTQTIQVRGGSSNINVSDFAIIYDSQYKQFTNNTSISTEVRVTSLDGAGTKSFKITLQRG
jgi:hypothetical protein